MTLTAASSTEGSHVRWVSFSVPSCDGCEWQTRALPWSAPSGAPLLTRGAHCAYMLPHEGVRRLRVSSLHLFIAIAGYCVTRRAKCCCNSVSVRYIGQNRVRIGHCLDAFTTEALPYTRYNSNHGTSHRPDGHAVLHFPLQKCCSAIFSSMPKTSVQKRPGSCRHCDENNQMFICNSCARFLLAKTFRKLVVFQLFSFGMAAALS